MNFLGFGRENNEAKKLKEENEGFDFLELLSHR
jgi:hypothetical protein